jgi:hypothetical protein
MLAMLGYGTYVQGATYYEYLQSTSPSTQSQGFGVSENAAQQAGTYFQATQDYTGINSINMQLYKVGTTTDSVVLSIYETTDGSTRGSLITQSYPQTITATTPFQENCPEWNSSDNLTPACMNTSFQFPNPITIASSTKYLIMASRTGSYSATNYYYLLARSGFGVGSENQAWRCNNNTTCLINDSGVPVWVTMGLNTDSTTSRIISFTPDKTQVNATSTASTIQVPYQYSYYFNDTTDFYNFDQVCVVFTNIEPTRGFQYTPICHEIIASAQTTKTESIFLTQGHIIVGVYFYNSETQENWKTSLYEFINGQSVDTQAVTGTQPQYGDEIATQTDCSALADITDKVSCKLGNMIQGTITFLFVPSQSVINNYQDIPTKLENKFPFSYYYDIKNTLPHYQARLGTGSTTPVVINSTYSTTTIPVGTIYLGSTTPFQANLEYFSMGTMRTFLPDSASNAIRTIIGYALWLGFVTMAWRALGRETSKNFS